MEQGKRTLIAAAVSAAAVLAVFFIIVCIYTDGGEQKNSSHYTNLLENSDYQMANSESLSYADMKNHNKTASLENKKEQADQTEDEQAADATEADPAAENASKETSICVFVCGKVKQAGIYQFLPGTRLGECIEAAGGFSKQADKEYLNLAKKAQDGQRIYVPSRKEAKKRRRQAVQNQIKEKGTKQKTIEKNTASQQTQTGINLNTASREELMQLSGIGETKADAIISYREEHNGFSSIEELMQISGIKDGIYQKICNDITI